MNNVRRGRICFSLGAVGLLLAAYMAYLEFQPQARRDSATMYLLLAIGISAVLAAGLNLYVAFGFYFGWVDAVVGAGDSASLIRGNTIVRENVRIQLVRRMDQDDLNLTDEERPVFFWVMASHGLAP